MTRICPTCGHATELDTAGHKPVQFCPRCNVVVDGLTPRAARRWSGPEHDQGDRADPEFTREALAIARDALPKRIAPGKRPRAAYSEPVTEP